MARPQVIAIMGAGEATGAAIAKRFAQEGYIVCLARRTGDALATIVDEIRTLGGKARAYSIDGRREEAVVEWFEHIERDVGPLEVAVYNIGGDVSFPILETTSNKYFKVWEMACFAGFLTAREAARHMMPRYRGTILFTGSSESVKGKNGYAAYAGAKHSLRALAQSMARELWPKGIHVAHVLIDGTIDTKWINDNYPQLKIERGVDGLLSPEHIADAYWFLHNQHRSAWTFELDLRPSVEPW